MQSAVAEGLSQAPSEIHVGIRDEYTMDGDHPLDVMSPSFHVHPYLRHTCISHDSPMWLACSFVRMLKALSTIPDWQESGDMSEQAALKAGAGMATLSTTVLKALSTICEWQESGDVSEQAALKAGGTMPAIELSPLQCLLSINFWLLFASFCIGAPFPADTCLCSTSHAAFSRRHLNRSSHARTSSLC